MSYAKLEAHFRRVGHLEHADAMLSWDEAVMMPEGGGASRADAMATLQVLIHELSTAPELGELLDGADAQSQRGKLEPWQTANLREMKWRYRRATSLPPDLVEAMAKAQLRSEQAWRKLRPRNDWTAFRPLLEQVVARKREAAQVLAGALGCSKYDALIDGFEPGVKSSEIDRLFEELRAFLPDFTRTALERQKRHTVIDPRGPFPLEQQRKLGLRAMRAVGFDFEHGRLDVSHHPFCGGVPRDVRITTRYDEGDFTKALMGVLHETGHAKYEQGLPERWLGQPVGHARGMSVHESQSLLQEMQVGRSREFLQFLAPVVRDELASAASVDAEAFTTDNLYRLYTRVRPGYIRVDADEVTYPAHIILRYDIEQRLIEGKIEVGDIPEIWDAAMRKLLGLSTEGNFKDGCMQDVHWPSGAFGYFPTYTLGALTAAQLFAAALQAHPTISGEIARGQMQTLNEWLRHNVWSQASLLTTDELLVRATGERLGVLAFRRHLERRYAD